MPDLADWCVVDVLDANGRLEPMAIAHADLDKVSCGRELRSRYPPDPNNADSPPYAVVQTGKPRLYTEIRDELLERSVSDPERLEQLRRIGMRSVMLVPMAVAGRVIGTVTLVTAESGRSFDGDDLEFAGDDGARRPEATAI